MSIEIAIAIGIAFLLLNALEAWLSYPMINQPIILCAVTGLIMGNLTAGLQIGATLQLVFLGVMGIGGTLPQDSALGSVIGTAFAISMNQNAEVALAFAVPVSVAGSFINLLTLIAKGLTNPLVEKWCREGNRKALEWFHRVLAFGAGIPKAIILIITLVVGTGFAQGIIDAVPQTIIDGLSYAGGLMPAVGIALLLRLMWSKKMAVYFFAGMVLISFFGLNMVGVATIGVILAVILSIESSGKVKKAGASSSEEELFND